MHGRLARNQIATIHSENIPQKQVDTATSSLSSSYKFTINRKLGSKGVDIFYLQKFLNQEGYTISLSGDGSEGKETYYFGRLTYNSLKKFQQKNNLTPSGYFGTTTRIFINAKEERN